MIRSLRSPILQPDRKTADVRNLAYRSRQASQVIALLVATVGVAVLCGWAFNVPALTYIRATLPSMKADTALSFVLLGVGLSLAHDDERQRTRRILGLVVVLIAGATLVEYGFHISLGIDELLFRDTRTPSFSAYPGRMAIATAICFLLLGLAVAFLGTKRAIALQRALVVACFAFSLGALCGYLYGVQSLYSITSFSTVALHTAGAFLGACLAYFLARPKEGIVSIAVSNSNSGFLLRRLLPAIIVVPILIGWLRVAGQRANLYDAPFGIALLVLGNIGCLTALTLLTVRSMHRLESEQSHSEEIVRESERRFRLVANAAPVLIWMSGANKLYTYFNEPWLDFTGRSLEQELGNGWAAGVHPDDLTRCLDTYQQSFDRREKFTMEYRLRRYDGQYRWILDIGVPRFGEDVSFAGYIGCCVDVSDRKQTEETRARYAAIVESSNDAIIGTDANQTVTDWNKGAERLFGYSAGEAIGRKISFLSATDRTDEAQGIMKKVLSGEAVENYETARRRKDGSWVEISLTASPILDAAGRVTGVSGITHDMTERKRAEETLRESEEKFRSVFRDAGVGMVIVSLEGRFLAANKAFCDCLGYTEEELLEKTIELITYPEDWLSFSQKLAKTLTEGRGFQWFEKRCLHKSGRIVYTESSASVIRNREGDPQYLVGQVLDVTERKRAEETISSMTRKLVDAQEQERARIGRELHDDINQRLAMLAVELEQLKENPTDVESRVEELRKQTTEISNDVQALSHELHASKLEYLGALGGIKNWCKEFAERQKIEIDCKLSAQSNLPADIGLCLFRVLQEALHNAAKHSGVKRIDVQLYEDCGAIHLIVRDLGRGFDIEVARQQSGLGLTSMRERVRLVKGTVEIHSKPMGGTTIHARVPLAPETSSQRAAG